MTKQYALFLSLTVLVMTLLLASPHAYAAPVIQPQFVSHYPHATCYYDDLVDHYEQDQIMRESIGEGI